MVPIELTRSVQVRVFETIASLAVPEPRPDLLAILEAVRLRGAVGGQDIGVTLLGRDASFGWRVLERCERLRLVECREQDKLFVLTEAGRRSLEEGNVLVPERGQYRILWVDDPLLPEVLLGFQRLEPEGTRNERDRAQEARKGTGPKLSPAPGVLAGICGRVTDQLRDGARIELLEIGQGTVGTAGSLEVGLRFEPSGEVVLHLHGAIDGAIQRILPAIDRVSGWTHRQVWETLIMSALDHEDHRLVDSWSAPLDRWTIARRFDKTSPQARRSMQEDLRAVQPRLHEASPAFRDVILPVRIAPTSPEDANRWARWLLWDSIADHRSRAELDELRGQVLARFPHHTPRLPTPDELLSEARDLLGKDFRAWRLVAPADLGLWEVTDG